MQFTITSDHAKMRLDMFLKEHFPNFSRSHIQKLIESGTITVNGKPATVHRFLKAGDEVEATIEPPSELLVVPNPNVPLNIIHEERDFIVLYKPAGLVTHQAEGHKAPDTLLNGILARYPEIGKVGDDPLRAGIVHRLDADVSGVMVVARTQDMFDHLKQQFKVHETQKEYIAIVHGQVTPPEGTIDFPMAKKGRRMVARPKGSSNSPMAKGEKRAVTEYETLKVSKEPKRSLVRIATRTGRMHQIRVHLNAIGHTILGDRLYGLEHGAKGKSAELLAISYKPFAGASRLMLHARMIAFKDLSGKWREYIAEPPPEFNTNS